MTRCPATTPQPGQVELTSPDKVLYPLTGTTKADVADYYQRIAELLLPQLSGRPVTRLRCPDGVEGERFFEKNLPAHAPAWIPRARRGHTRRVVAYPLVDDVATLGWLAQQAALELHVPQWRLPAGTDLDAVEPTPPDRLVLDLDPGPGRGLDDCIEVGRVVHDWLGTLGAEAVPVTSGSKGLHLYVPWPIPGVAGTAKEFARKLAETAEAADPGRWISSMARAKREGRVLLDWSQNDVNKTTVAPYSLRARDVPYVAAPRTWPDLERDPRQLTLDDVLHRLR